MTTPTMGDRDRDGGGSRGRMTDDDSFAEVMESARYYGQRIVAQELSKMEERARHATYCPQHYPCPEDAGGSSWLCVCSGPLVELRAAVQALLDSEYGSNSWAEGFDVVQGIMAEQERLEWEAEAVDLARVDRAAEVAFRGEEHVARLEREANRG